MSEGKNLTACVVCGSNVLETVMDMPAFPLTGIYVTAPEPDRRAGFDQALNVCRGCGHLQLAVALPPRDLYEHEYSHRTTSHHLSGAASDFFAGYLESLTPGRKLDCILEVGCNELVLLNKLSDKAERLYGVDPIWIGDQPQSGETADNVAVMGGYIEDVDLAGTIHAPADLIISTHNLEHIVDPRAVLEKLLGCLSDDGMIVMEVPDTDCMVAHRRFDQVFHQHIHYLNLASYLKLIEAAGGRYIAHARNPKNWGGSLSVAFGRPDHPRATTAPDAHVLTPALTRQSYEDFRSLVGVLMRTIAAIKCPLVGYGAGQMVPAVAYHLGSNLDFLDVIYDDDENRDGMFYPHLAPAIAKPTAELVLDEASVVITALDAVRPIASRVRGLGAKFVYVPTQAY